MQEGIILRNCILWCKKSESDRSKKNKNLSLLANHTIKPRLSSKRLTIQSTQERPPIKYQLIRLILMGEIHEDIKITA